MLVLVLIAGSDLATGNMMLVPLSAMRGKVDMSGVARNLLLVLLGNLLGAVIFVSTSYWYLLLKDEPKQ